jgi:uncharacterized protein YndB with AHSA1/START domain
MSRTIEAPRELVVTRRFAAPPEQVFDAWFDAKAVGTWLFATAGGFSHHVRIDARVGGRFEIFELRGDELARHYGTYLEIERPRRLAFTLSRNRGDEGSRIVVEIAPDGAGGSVLTLTHALDPQWTPLGDAVRSGWAGILDGLARQTSEADAGHSIILFRTFSAPRALVWKAWTAPEHLMRWLCPAEFTTLFAENDLRLGGAWRAGMRSPDGENFIHCGEYVEIDPPRRLVFSHRWEQNSREPQANTLIAVTLNDVDGKTQMIFAQSGLATLPSALSHKAGWTGAFEFLAEFLRGDAQADD